MTRQFVVSASNVDTSRAAAEVLEKGGNAFDAILAALFTSFVSEPLLSSPGGGGYLLAKSKDSSPVLYDFFSQTPQNKWETERDFFPIEGDFGDNKQEFHIGLAAAAVPGVLSGIHSIHHDLCTMPLNSLASYAIEKALHGVTVDSNFQLVLKILSPIIESSESAKALFEPHRQPLTNGESFCNPQLGEFLKEFSKQDKDWFYQSPLVEKICNDMQQGHGLLREEDFKSYKTLKREPLHWRYKDWNLYSNSQPALGGEYIVDQLHHALNAHAESYANVVAAMQMVEQKRLQAKSSFQSSKGTTHFSVIDPSGNAASLTISNGEGNGYMVEEGGFMLNNFLGEEDINQDGFFNWQENTRMASMMSPTLLTQPDSIIAMGTGGSNRIKTALFQVIYALIKENKSLVEAVNQPRMHFEKDLLEVEKGFHSGWLNDLDTLDLKTHIWQQRSLYFGGVNAVQHGKTSLAVADSRRCGQSIIHSKL